MSIVEARWYKQNGDGEMEDDTKSTFLNIIVSFSILLSLSLRLKFSPLLFCTSLLAPEEPQNTKIFFLSVWLFAFWSVHNTGGKKWFECFVMHLSYVVLLR